MKLFVKIFGGKNLISLFSLSGGKLQRSYCRSQLRLERHCKIYITLLPTTTSGQSSRNLLSTFRETVHGFPSQIKSFTWVNWHAHTENDTERIIFLRFIHPTVKPLEHVRPLRPWPPITRTDIKEERLFTRSFTSSFLNLGPVWKKSSNPSLSSLTYDLDCDWLKWSNLEQRVT